MEGGAGEGVRRKCKEDGDEPLRKQRRRVLRSQRQCVWERRRSRAVKDKRRQERLVTSGYGACRYSAGSRGVRGMRGGG